MSDQDKFHWAKRSSRWDIQRLYESDAEACWMKTCSTEKVLPVDWLIHQFHVMCYAVCGD